MKKYQTGSMTYQNALRLKNKIMFNKTGKNPRLKRNPRGKGWVVTYMRGY